MTKTLTKTEACTKVERLHRKAEELGKFHGRAALIKKLESIFTHMMTHKCDHLLDLLVKECTFDYEKAFETVQKLEQERSEEKERQEKAKNKLYAA
jgi:hypothetical protein